MTRLPLSASFLLALVAGSPLLAGCPKKGPSVDAEVLAVDPRANFAEGARLLQPDRKGAVDYAGAYAYFAKAADELGGGKKAEFNAGWVAERMGDLPKATAHYRDAFEADPTYLPAMYSYARLLGEQGKNDEAAAVFARYLEVKPDDLTVRSEYMDALVEAGNFEGAIAEGEAILRKDASSAAVYRSLSALYLKKGMLQMAAIMGDKALELDDKDPNVYNNMGVVLLQQERVDEALDKFEMARTLDSTHFEANMNIGAIALDSGDYARALDCFDKALQRNPASLDARLGKAVALRGSGDFAGAGALYDEIIKSNPDAQAAYFNAATLHERYTKDFVKALKYLTAWKDRQAGSLSPSDPVFARMEKVAELKAAEEERIRLEEERKKAEEERKRRARETLDKMAAVIAETRGKLEQYASCIPEEVGMEVGMILEEVAAVVEAEDTEMATDVKQMLDEYYLPMLDAAVADGCGVGGGEDAAPEGEEGTSEGGADETPAPQEAPSDAPAETP